MRVRIRLITAALPCLLTLASVRPAAAQQQTPVRRNYERQIPAALLAQVKIGEDSARGLALAKVPGDIEAVELLRDHGNLLWVWDVKVKGRRGITEVSVNAIDGKVESHVE